MARKGSSLAVKKRVCKDCPSTSTRPAPFAGPRCATHNRQRRREVKLKAHAAHVLRSFGITGDQYWAIYEAQGRRCYLCQRATGQTKFLPVDHDHKCCPELPACGKCVRGLLCGPCNQGVLGHLRDDREALLRGVDYLDNPPARRVLGLESAA